MNEIVKELRNEIKNGTYTFYIEPKNKNEYYYLIEDREGYIAVLDGKIIEEYGIY